MSVQTLRETLGRTVVTCAHCHNGEEDERDLVDPEGRDVEHLPRAKENLYSLLSERLRPQCLCCCSLGGVSSEEGEESLSDLTLPVGWMEKGKHSDLTSAF
jgi:hypothetical protein